ncbi:MAG TPA: PhzF family phenazine biosynthesis protein [Amnibacterium sp.]|nr:PhzF family phenazine biosynthesis protein [Amnibacterium sp.]
MATYPFRQVDVFPGSALGGNPVAVVLDADDLDDATMREFARWTNLSETTFVLRPVNERAHYRLRIFTPADELPFAGHPTLGSASAWADHAGFQGDRLVQECGVGLVDLRRTEDGFALAAPPLIRSGAPTAEDLAAAVTSLRLDPDRVVDAQWTDNGPGWLAIRLRDAETVLGIVPDFEHMPVPIGVVGAHAAAGPADFEVRAFVPGLGVPEDPVTGSLNAGIGTWFFGAGIVDAGYTVRQGTVLGGNGLVRVSRDSEGVWVSGACSTRVSGTVTL